ncbi:hypothetical protein HID58_064512, partial [Brassica napus]
MMKAGEGGFGWQVWHGNGTAQSYQRASGKFLSFVYFGEKQYAIGYVEDLPIYGTKATL